jgi:hypothetical protein
VIEDGATRLQDWQQNFFVLHSNGLLQGYSKRGGKLVAEVNVTKFEARTLSPTEISGFNHCFQLQKPKTKIPLTLQVLHVCTSQCEPH